MAEQKPQMNMPKFNLNWVYAIIIGVLAVLFFTGKGRNSINKEVD